MGVSLNVVDPVNGMCEMNGARVSISGRCNVTELPARAIKRVVRGGCTELQHLWARAERCRPERSSLLLWSEVLSWKDRLTDKPPSFALRSSTSMACCRRARACEGGGPQGHLLRLRRRLHPHRWSAPGALGDRVAVGCRRS